MWWKAATTFASGRSICTSSAEEPAAVADLREGGREPLRRQRDDDHGPQARRLGIRLADDRQLVSELAQLGGLGLRPLGIARADDDRVADARPARRQSRAFLAGAAEDRDVHRTVYLKRSRAGSRRSGFEPSSLAFNASPRTIAAGM